MDPNDTSATPGGSLTRRTLMGLGASAVTGLVLGSHTGTAAAAGPAAAVGGPLAPSRRTTRRPWCAVSSLRRSSGWPDSW